MPVSPPNFRNLLRLAIRAGRQYRDCILLRVRDVHIARRIYRKTVGVKGSLSHPETDATAFPHGGEDGGVMEAKFGFSLS